MLNEIRFWPQVDDNFSQVMYDRNKHGGKQSTSYQLSKLADTRVSCFSLKKQLSQCHFFRTEEGRHFGKEVKCVLGQNTTENRNPRRDSLPYIIAFQMVTWLYAWPEINPWSFRFHETKAHNTYLWLHLHPHLHLLIDNAFASSQYKLKNNNNNKNLQNYVQ